MARYTRNVPVTIEDVNDSFRRFIETAPKIARAYLSDAVSKTTFAVGQRMKALAPVGPVAPHIRDVISVKLPSRSGLSGRAGILGADATLPSGPHASGEASNMAHIALYNEYSPNKQSFMRPAALKEASEFRTRAMAALLQVERDLSGGGGLV